MALISYSYLANIDLKKQNTKYHLILQLLHLHQGVNLHMEAISLHAAFLLPLPVSRIRTRVRYPVCPKPEKRRSNERRCARRSGYISTGSSKEQNRRIDDKESWGRVMYMDLLEWSQSVRIFVTHAI